jgi:hypothetical protein
MRRGAAPDLGVNRIGQTFDFGESARAARRIGATDRLCWYNAIRALRRVFRHDPSARYVEGHALSKGGLSAEHGWIEIGGQGIITPPRIVDPTPIWHERRDDIACYFAGPRYAIEDLRGVRLDAPGWLPLIFSPLLPATPEQRRARLDLYAEAHAQCLALMMEVPIARVRALLRGEIPRIIAKEAS